MAIAMRRINPGTLFHKAPQEGWRVVKGFAKPSCASGKPQQEGFDDMREGLFISQLRAEGNAGFFHGCILLCPEFLLAFQVTSLGDFVPFLGSLVKRFFW